VVSDKIQAAGRQVEKLVEPLKKLLVGRGLYLPEDYCLGVYYHANGATAVRVLKDNAGNVELGDVMRVDGDDIAVQLSGMLPSQSGVLPVALALGGMKYQTYFYHSEFLDRNKIDETLRFDIEEEIAIDAEAISLCYEMRHSESEGSELTIHTTDRNELGELLSVFEHAELDALVVQPDIVSWEYYLREFANLENGSLVVAWSKGVLYLAVLDQLGRALVTRTILCDSSDAVDDILSMELGRSLALADEAALPSVLWYHQADLNEALLAKISLEFGLEVKPLEQSDAGVAFAIGAALAYFADGDAADFCADSLTPATVKKIRKYGIFGLAAVVSLLAIVFGFIMHIRAGRYEQVHQSGREQIAQMWHKAFPDKKDDTSTEQKLKNLRTLYRSASKRASGGKETQAATQSAAYTLMLVLDALDTLPEKFDLVITQLATGPGETTLTGSLAGLAEKEKLDSVFNEDEQLEIVKWDVRPPSAGKKGAKGTRRTFNVTLRVKK